jgi:antitoxin HicB
MTTLEDYLHLPYHLTLVHDHDADGNAGWVAEVAELPGCIAQGSTQEEALERLQDAMVSWLSVALEDGLEILEPRDAESYSGRFLLRLPHSLHAELARAAEDEGVSLNQFVSAVLASAVSWRGARDDVRV